MKIPLRQYWNLLVHYLGPQWPSVVLLTVLLFGTIGLQLVNPQIARQFIDAAQGGAPPEALLRVALLFLGAAVLQQTASVSAAYLGENVGWKATNDLRAHLAEHCLRLDMSFHNAHTPGEMIERVDGDVNALANFFSLLALQLLGNELLLVGVLVLLYREDWRIGIGFTLFAAAALATRWRVSNIAAPHWRAERAASADQFGFIQERLAGTEDIRSNGAQGYVMRRFYVLVRDLMSKYLKVRLMVNIAVNTSHLLFAVANATAFALGAYLYQAGSVTLGTVFMISWYGNTLMGPIRSINYQVQDLQQAAAGISRIQELLAVESKIAAPNKTKDKAVVSVDALSRTTLPQTALAVAFENVTFGYAGQQAQDLLERDDTKTGQDAVLRDLSFHLRPGTILGLLGRTGSGKTTLTRLLFRLYDPDQGAVYLGSDDTLIDVRQLPLDALRQHVAMVTQDIQLFHASVRDNLTFFDRTIPDDTIAQVICDLGLGEWFRSLPQGLDTELTSGGGLSAGEAQLLAFTRVFLRDPGLVILDEASSRLDPVTEQLIERAVDRLVQRRTAIVIAHHLATVQRADQIMILEQGQIREYGPRAALAGDPASHYYGLLYTGLEEVLA